MGRSCTSLSDRLRSLVRARQGIATVDVLSDVLASVRLGSAMIGAAALTRPWGISVEPMRNAAIHLVLRGECWLRLAGEPVHVLEGDVILVGSGVGHTLSDPANAPLSSMAAALAAGPRNRNQPDGGNESTTLLCAKYQLDGSGPHPMISLLPPLIHLTRAQIEANAPLRLATELLRVEASGDLTGHDLVAPRLLDSVLVFLLRAWIESQPLGTAGWFGALRDKGVAQALRLDPRAPGSSLDRRIAGCRRIAIARHIRTAVHQAGRRTTAGLCRALADQSRCQGFAGDQSYHRRDRTCGRL